MDLKVASRLDRRLVRQPNGCLEWQGRRTRQGYGQITVAGESVYAHRVAWERAHGPIPKGMCVLHHCDNPPCGETDPSEAYPEGHLFLGTRATNAADMVAKGRHNNGHRDITHCPQKHEYDEENTYIRPDGGRGCRACRSR